MTNKKRQKKKRITESKNKISKLVTFSIDDEVLMNVRDSDFSEDEPCSSSKTCYLSIDIRLLAAQTMKKMFTVSVTENYNYNYICIQANSNFILDC